MKYKVIAFLMICFAVAAAGCTTGYQGNSASSAAQDEYYTSDSSGYRTDMKVAYAPDNTPAPAYAEEAVYDGGAAGGIETKIIKTAYLTIEVNDVTGSVESLKAMAAEKGGYLSSTNIQKNYNDHLSGTVVMRIPQADFENTLLGVKALGTVKSASTQGQDVTEEYVDLEAQKTSYLNQLAQYNAIMKQSTKVEDIIKVQEQIDRVQTELNRLEGRLRYMDSRIDLSTITVNLQEPEPVGGDTGHSFVATLNEGIAGFIGMIDAIIILFFTLMPLFILGGIGYWAWRWHKGRKGHSAPAEEKKENQ